MKTLKGPFSYIDHSRSLRILVLSFAVLSVLLIGIHCDESDDTSAQFLQSGTPSDKSADTETRSVSSALGNLYIENFNDPARNQLAKLLCDDSYKKLIFQTYKLKDGRLTLVVFAGKQNEKEFNPYFHVLNWVDDAVVEDMQDKEVFLGDHRLNDDKEFKLLKDAINKGPKNDTSRNYIVFTPELKQFSNDRKYVIEYSIRFTSSLDGFASQILPAGSARLHPSPPYYVLVRTRCFYHRFNIIIV